MDQRREIRVLGHHPGASGARGLEDLEIGRALERQGADAGAIDAQVGTDARGERRRQLVVEPEGHVTP